MFWNSRFFRKHGFEPVKRTEMPASAAHFRELSDPVFRRSSVMLRSF
jgi:N-acetylglutamate synthase-like GNAT family acetyltransferase